MAMQSGGIEFSEGGVKVLHVLAKSFPELNGYAIRGHELIREQKKSKMNLVSWRNPLSIQKQVKLSINL